MPKSRDQRSARQPTGAPLGGGRLSTKVVLVTGAGRGIGRATAELFAREGARIVLGSRTKRELDAVVTAIQRQGGLAVGRRADIASPRQAGALVRFAMQQFGRLDILINNAGVLGPRVSIAEYPPKAWNEVIRINLNGTFYVTREATRTMLTQGRGCIITVSSSVGRKGRACWGSYAVSKFGAEGLMQVLADEVRSTEVCTMTFNPGGTRTRMRAEAYPDEDPTQLRDPSEAARALLHLACSASSQLSGRSFDAENLP